MHLDQILVKKHYVITWKDEHKCIKPKRNQKNIKGVKKI